MDKVALLFPGQNSQFVGMGKWFYERYESAKHIYCEAEDILGYDLSNICFEGNAVRLNDMDILYPAIFTTNVAIYQAYMDEIGEQVSFMAGHSIGEYSALVASGAISFGDAMDLIILRGKVIKKSSDLDGHMMLVEGIHYRYLERICRSLSRENVFVTISCYNTVYQNMVSGNSVGLELLGEKLRTLEVRLTPLFTSPPFHCSLMKNVKTIISEKLEQISLYMPEIPVINSYFAIPYKSTQDIKQHLIEQVITPVCWCSVMKYLANQGVTRIVELGAQAVLTNFKSAAYGKYNSFAYGSIKEQQRLEKNLQDKGVATKKEQRTMNEIRFVNMCLTEAVASKNYSSDIDSYKESYSLYKQLEELQIQASTGNNVCIDITQKACQLLLYILEKKESPRSILDYWRGLCDNIIMRGDLVWKRK